MVSEPDAGPPQDTRFTHRVLAVFAGRSDHTTQEGKDGGEEGEENTSPMSRRVHHFVTLDANYGPSSSVLFRLSVLVCNETRVYVQLLPDRIRSLTRIPHDDPVRTPELDTVRSELKERRLVCLHFLLYQPGDLIAPEDFALDKSNAEALYNMNSITSIASALDFSLYMKLGALTKSKFHVFSRELQEPPSAAVRAALEWKANISRLYNGKGGVVLDRRTGLVASPASCASTVAVSSPPGYGDQPDVDSAGLPPYQKAIQPRKRARSGSSDTDSRYAKISGPHDSVGGTSARPGDEYMPRCASGFASVSESRLQGVFDQLLSRIAQLEHTTEMLHTQNNRLEAQSVRQQQEIESLGAQTKALEKETEETAVDSSVVKNFEHQMNNLCEELDDGQTTMAARLDSVEETAESTDLRVTALEYVLDENWRSELAEDIKNDLAKDIRSELTEELVDQVKERTIAKIRDFLRNI